MAFIDETAYPRFKSSYTKNELAHTFLLDNSEKEFVTELSKKRTNQVVIACHLKVLQRLGYFCSLSDIPKDILLYVSEQFDYSGNLKNPKDIADRTIRIYQQAIREHLNLQIFDDLAKKLVLSTMNQSAEVKDESADIINDALEILVKESYMLPSFQLLSRLAKRVRSTSYLKAYRKINDNLTEKDYSLINELFLVPVESNFTLWNELRKDAKKATLSNLKNLLYLNSRLQEYQFHVTPDQLIHYSKLEQMLAEASSCNAAQMKEMKSVKRNALAVVYLQKTLISCKDNLIEMMIKRILSLHSRGKQKLATHREQTQQQTDNLIKKFHNILEIYHTESAEQRLSSIEQFLDAESLDCLKSCEAYLAYEDNNYLPFLLPSYKAHRATLFKVLNAVEISSTSNDINLEKAIQFLKSHQKSKKDILADYELDFSWLPTKWINWIKVENDPSQSIYRKHLEIAVFTFIVQELKTGDLCVKGSEKYADYREQLLSWDEYYLHKEDFCQQLSLPEESTFFIDQLQQKFYQVTLETDQHIPKNTEITLENNQISLKKIKGKKASKELLQVERYLQKKIPERSILDILLYTLLWLKWDRYFGPISKYDSKLKNPRTSYLATLFCYGTNLGYRARKGNLYR